MINGVEIFSGRPEDGAPDFTPTQSFLTLSALGCGNLPAFAPHGYGQFGMELSGQTLVGGKYTVIRPLGEGSYGVVYLVEEKYTGRRLAVKRLRDTGSKASFSEELKFLARLERIPHVLPLLTPDEDETGALLIVSPYMDAGTLHRRILQCGPMEEPEILDILIDVTQALDKAHALGILHKDIKPENIFGQNEKSGKITWFLGDWGMAGAKKGTGTVKMACTLEYMAPELADGKRVPASDIYALGCTLFYMAVGDPPFTGSLGEMIELHRTREPEIPGKLSPGMRNLLSAMLDKNPAKRHDTAWLLEQMEKLKRGGAPTFWFGDAFQGLSGKADARAREHLAPARPGKGGQGRFTVLEGALVEDRTTGLQWVMGPDVDANWDEASYWAGGLTYGGGGWRMPRPEELEALMEKNGDNRQFRRVFNTTGQYVWGGETASDGQAWNMFLGTGIGFFDGVNRASGRRVFAVRKIPSPTDAPNLMETVTLGVPPKPSPQPSRAVNPPRSSLREPAKAPRTQVSSSPAVSKNGRKPKAPDKLLPQQAAVRAPEKLSSFPATFKLLVFLGLVGMVIYIWWPTLDFFMDVAAGYVQPRMQSAWEAFSAWEAHR